MYNRLTCYKAPRVLEAASNPVPLGTSWGMSFASICFHVYLFISTIEIDIHFYMNLVKSKN